MKSLILDLVSLNQTLQLERLNEESFEYIILVDRNGLHRESEIYLAFILSKLRHQESPDQFDQLLDIQMQVFDC